MSRSAVAAMTAYTLELREAEIKLNQNESPYDWPRALKEQVLAHAVERPWNIYPDFESSGLRNALAKAYGLVPENIHVGNGSNELLAATIGAFVGPGTPVIFPRPTFTLYEKLVTIAGGLPIPIEFEPDSGLLPLEEMMAAIRDDAVVILCSPNNPTGGVLPEGGLQRLIDSEAMVLFDRAYGDFANDTFPALHSRLVTFSTFSKAWGLAALRVGWVASTVENCREIRKVKLPYSLNAISEMAATIALENRAIRDANVARIVGERERVVAAMREIPRITMFPTRANFVTFRAERNSKEIFEALFAHGILVRDVSAYPRLANCLRISIGSPEQNDRVIEVLREVV
ncbi:MAG TPA: histidinol-phosphate transaminase [Thermoanaerobaculia bacterium]|nr:histidinol-phosphate transaminase [Thermoanaerobaculia bacterium]